MKAALAGDYGDAIRREHGLLKYARRRQHTGFALLPRRPSSTRKVVQIVRISSGDAFIAD